LRKRKRTNYLPEEGYMKIPTILKAIFCVGLSILAGCVPIKPQSAVAPGQPISPVQTSAVDVCNIREGEVKELRIYHSHVVTTVVNGVVQEVRIEKSNLGLSVAIMATGTPTTTSPMRNEVWTSDAVRKIFKEFELESALVGAFGPERVGNVITVAGEDITIPDGFCVNAFLPNVDCRGEQCTVSPIYTIGNRQSGHLLAVSTKTGEIGDASLSAAEVAALKKEFQWLVDAIGKE
jgi:hypothetical protein